MNDQPCSSCADLRAGAYPEWTVEDHPCFKAGLGQGQFMNRPRNPCLCGCIAAQSDLDKLRRRYRAWELGHVERRTTRRLVAAGQWERVS